MTHVMLGNVYRDVKNRTGIVVRLDGSPRSKGINIIREICDRIKELIPTGHTSFIFEISDFDFEKILIPDDSEIERISYYIDDLGFRIGFYLKTGNYFSTTDSLAGEKSKIEIVSIGRTMRALQLPEGPESPLIIHLGSAQGDRKGIMEKFCEFHATLSEDIRNRICVINDEKPSLFSVKDLLPGVTATNQIPIVFRSISFPTNQGNLSYRESLFLAASSWPKESSPIIIYLPYGKTLESDEMNPYGMSLDIIFDNHLPDPE